MSERPKVQHSKCCLVKANVGSNPTVTANEKGPASLANKGKQGLLPCLERTRWQRIGKTLLRRARTGANLAPQPRRRTPMCGPQCRTSRDGLPPQRDDQRHCAGNDPLREKNSPKTQMSRVRVRPCQWFVRGISIFDRRWSGQFSAVMRFRRLSSNLRNRCGVRRQPQMRSWSKTA